VDGDTPRHRCLKVPVGTPATTLLEAAGVNVGNVDDDQILADGGPGWCYKIDISAEEFGVRKRTNGLLVLDRTVAKDHTEDDGQIDVLDVYDWSSGDHETEPEVIEPESVRIPLITNAAYTGVVTPSEAIVETGDKVSDGETIAVPGVADAAVTMECTLHDTKDLHDRVLLFGDVQHVHVAESAMTDGEIDARNLRTVGRLGGPYYTTAVPGDFERQY
jgi:hypothetical protein